MSKTCLNPDCENEPIGFGVCLGCANGTYRPENDGIDLGNGITVSRNNTMRNTRYTGRW